MSLPNLPNQPQQQEVVAFVRKLASAENISVDNNTHQELCDNVQDSLIAISESVPHNAEEITFASDIPALSEQTNIKGAIENVTNRVPVLSMNGTTNIRNIYDWYAPIDSGEPGQILQSNGILQPPQWVSDLDIGENKLILSDPEREESETYRSVYIKSVEKTGGNGVSLDIHADNGSTVFLQGIKTPMDNTDAANKQYVDDTANTRVVLTCFLDENNTLLMPSSAYQQAYEYATVNKSVYIKLINSTGNIIWLLCVDWINFNGHPDGTDAFVFTSLESQTHASQVILTSSSATFTSAPLETTLNKQSDILNNLSNTLYPSTNAVYNLIRPHVIWEDSNGLENLDVEIQNVSWQITGVDLSPYRYVEFHTLEFQGINNAQKWMPKIVRVYLDDSRALTSHNCYVGSLGSAEENDRNVNCNVTFAVSADKTSFSFVSATGTYGTALSHRGVKMFKCVGYLI